MRGPKGTLKLVTEHAPDTVRTDDPDATLQDPRRPPHANDHQASGDVAIGEPFDPRVTLGGADPPVLRPGDRIGDLVIERQLARGGIGELYVAKNEVLNKSFAVKVLSLRFRARDDVRLRLLAEARALAEFSDHPGIVQVYTASVDPWVGPYLVMDLLPGGTLRQLLRLNGALGVPRALAMAILIANITEDLHARGIVHRDLKPENVFVVTTKDGDFRIVILDLGCIKAPYTGGTTDRTNAMGTVRYMSAEQLRGEKVGTISDQVALGHMLYEMVVGEHAFEDLKREAGDVGPATEASWQLHGVIHPPPESVCPAPLWQIITRLLARSPASRFPSMRAASDVMSRLLATLVEHRSDEVLRGLVSHPQMTPRQGTSSWDTPASLTTPPALAKSHVEVPEHLSPGVTGPRRTAGRAGGLSKNPECGMTSAMAVATLVVRKDGRPTRRFVVGDGAVIGRDSVEADIELEDASVSRKHVELQLDDEQRLRYVSDRPRRDAARTGACLGAGRHDTARFRASS